ncbi:MAG: hypothetical protein MJ124_01470 [Lachnospiraceae bacterium]|nr:hypothetical protein [Lachnospiraceae bacterium]
MDDLEKQLRYGDNEPEQMNNNQGSESPLAAAVRFIFSGGSVLAMIILLGVRIVASMSSAIIGRSTMYYNLGEYFEEILGSEAAAEYYDMLNEADMLGRTGNLMALLGAFIGAIPMLLTLLGFILIYVNAKSEAPKMSTSGLKILKVMNMIGFVGYIIAAAFCILIPIIGAMAGALVSSSASGIVGAVMIVLVMVGLFAAAFMLLFIFRNWGFHSSIKCLETVLIENRIRGKISNFAAWFTIILGGFGALGIFSYLIIGNWAGCLLIIGESGYMILLGINMLKLSGIINQSSNQ